MVAALGGVVEICREEDERRADDELVGLDEFETVIDEYQKGQARKL